MGRLCTIVLATALTVGLGPSTDYPPPPPAKPPITANREASYGKIAIAFEEVTFPPQWENPFTVELVPPDKRPAILQKLHRELQKYPQSLLEQNLSRIYLMESLSHHESRWGGTYSSSAVYLTHPWTFHGEFSSILLRNNPSAFPALQWTSHNGSCAYTNNGREIVGTVIPQPTHNSALLNCGFLTTYAQTSLENDLNAYAREFFLSPRSVLEKAGQYPAIYGKLNIMLDFYKAVSNRTMDTGYYNGMFTQMYTGEQPLANRAIELLPQIWNKK